MMTLSGHNIVSRLADSKDYFIVNPLSGQADILDAQTAQRMESGTLTSEEREQFTEKGYLVDPDEETRRYRNAYLDFLKARDSSEIQLFYVPSYACNFNCSYCYQEGYDVPGTAGEEVLDAFFSYQKNAFGNAPRYFTLFGGEPLMAGETSRRAVSRFLERAHAEGIDTAVVTNGYHLIDYLDILENALIREIQVTVDGTREVHDGRRPLKKGGPTFDRIVEGIDGALSRGIPVNLRMVVDRENIGNLPDLARFAVEKGWTASPLFKTQLGRNYELHTCSGNQAALYNRIDMYRDLYSLIQKEPVITEFHRPAYSISRFLFDNGEMPMPLFDSCPGCKTEWAFDYSGQIYSCTATVGKKGEELGTFYPEVSLDSEAVEKWEERDVMAISECGTCNLRLACGGGCGSVAKNATGELHSPDCRPVRELLEMGLSLYFDKQSIPEA